jgi:pilus assembly protein CpaE
MPIYFLGAAIEQGEGEALEKRIRQDIPHLEKVESVEDLSRRLPPQPQAGAGDRAYLLFPFSHSQTSVDRLVEIAGRVRNAVFFIFISDDISASDYKRLVRTENADWVSMRGAPQEILDVISRHRRVAPASEPVERTKPLIVSFVPSGGGVGNATIAIETAVQLKTDKATRARAVCLTDLDFQTSHVCDLLDIESRLQIAEIVADPERLDAQLFELFVSHHSTGLDVLAAARTRNVVGTSIAALDALFGIMSRRYEVIFVDLPVAWLDWTRQILSVSDLAVVTGVNTIPGLRQVAETIKVVRDLEHPPRKIVVAVNRCETGLLGRVADQRYAKRILDSETVFYIRDDPVAARQSVNTGVPISLGAQSSRISKDISPLTTLVSGLQVTRAPAGQ